MCNCGAQSRLPIRSCRPISHRKSYHLDKERNYTFSSYRRKPKNPEFAMLRGALIAFAIMLVAIPIPIVHFVAIPISPFVAGFIGGGIAKADEMKIVWFGLIVGALMLIPSAAIITYWQVGDAEKLLGAPTWFWALVGIAIAPYAWFGATIGALVSFLMRSKGESKAAS